ncbi:MAG: hypothetical protein VX529_11755 [Pseudomonadota bacterium]|nr:hypothetical protein [Pseudomonadota bacterium]
MFRLIDPAQASALQDVEWAGGRVAPLEMGAALYYLPQSVIGRLPEDVAALIGAGAGSAADDAELLAAGQSAAIAAAAAERWQRTLLFTYDGVTAYADPAIAPLTAKILALDEADSDDPVNFKLSETDWRSWTRTQLRAYGAAINTHIQACFDNEKALVDAIAAATDRQSLNAVDLSAGWP